MKIEVTEEHYIQSLKGSHYERMAISCYCPVARALKDVFKVKFAQVTYNTLTVGGFPGDRLIFTQPTPYELTKIIHKFDINGIFEPFEFELSLEGVKL